MLSKLLSDIRRFRALVQLTPAPSKPPFPWGLVLVVVVAVVVAVYLSMLVAYLTTPPY